MFYSRLSIITILLITFVLTYIYYKSNTNNNSIYDIYVEMNKLERLTYEVHGHVQGVFFRKHTINKAKSLQLVGYVQNTNSDTVSGIAEGISNNIKEFGNWLYTGSPHSKVDKVDEKYDSIDKLTYNEFTQK